MNEIEVTMDCEKCEAHIRADEMAKFNYKLDELEIKYEIQYGVPIPEMYADIFFELKKWLKEQSNGE